METYQNVRTKNLQPFFKKIGKKRKSEMPELIGTVIIRAQQSLENAGGLNSVQTEIDDEIILNKLKK